ncbi:glycosyltransferase [Candidatus Woesebacteria bacterium]|jgi:glycosyltransferase involved in cell wall biosynthesis|nr:glycosyltransferase [Candidatus Woesebacteria bacterium]MBP9687190.1 glycosyltransferase [Candidatus Woesebacteria bacterium]
MKVALVYDRVNKWGGAERVLMALHELYPDAPLFTSVYNKETAPWANSFDVKTSFLQNIPFARNNHEYFAPLMPLAFENLDMSGYDTIISVSSEAAKGILTHGHQKHIAYCLTPTRYLWSGHKNYFQPGIKSKLATPLISYLRSWDQVAAQRADQMISISTEVKHRIHKFYGRDTQIIFPPVETNLFEGIPAKNKKKHFLLVSRLVKYKKVDLAIKAFNKLGYPLVIVGTGREEPRLKKIAAKNITFAGAVDDKKLAQLYSNAIALVFPQEEDFGIVAVEAQSVGIPVIAFARGGALDTVIPGETGVFFKKQNVGSLIGAVSELDKVAFNRENIVEHAKMFSREVFLKNFSYYINNQ